MKIRNTLFSSIILFIILTTPALAQKEQALPDKTRILFLLDASGSMLAPWENQKRIDVAKYLLADIVDSLKTRKNLELGLRVYGHLYPHKFQNCKDSKLEVPFAANNFEQIKTKLKDLNPKGTTPIAYSLEQAANDFPNSSNVRNIIIIITDGLESCGGDPCKVSYELQKKNIFLKPFVIALGSEAGFEKQFNCIGEYYDASSIDKFRKALNKALKQSLGKTTVSVELLDIKDKPTITDVNVTFVNNFTQEVKYNFIHYLDSKGQPDTLEIDPVLSYDLIINTIPPLYRRDVEIVGGEHNVIKIKAPQGTLLLNQKNYREYKDGVKAIIRPHQHPQTLHTQTMGSSEKYVVGFYDVEVLTLPRVTFEKVAIKSNEITSLDLPAPGIANIRSNVAGIGDIYVLKEGNTQQLILKLDEKNSVNSLALQPGTYRLIFRAKNAQGSSYTKVRDFTITSGATTNINLFGR